MKGHKNHHLSPQHPPTFNDSANSGDSLATTCLSLLSPKHLEIVPSFSHFSISVHLILLSLCSWWASLWFSWEKVTVWPIKESYEEVLDAPEVSVSVAFHSEWLWHLHGFLSTRAINKSGEPTSPHKLVQETLSLSLRLLKLPEQSLTSSCSLKTYNKHILPAHFILCLPRLISCLKKWVSSPLSESVWAAEQSWCLFWWEKQEESGSNHVSTNSWLFYWNLQSQHCWRHEDLLRNIEHHLT